MKPSQVCFRFARVRHCSHGADLVGRMVRPGAAVRKSLLQNDFLEITLTHIRRQTSSGTEAEAVGGLLHLLKQFMADGWDAGACSRMLVLRVACALVLQDRAKRSLQCCSGRLARTPRCL